MPRDGRRGKTFHISAIHFSRPSNGNTVNVHIFAQLNFRASGIRRHIRAAKFSRTYQLTLSVLL